MFRKTPVPEFLFSAATFFKKRLWHKSFPVNFERFLREPLLQNLDACSILQQLLALYFAIMCSWQLSSSEKSSVKKKDSSISLKVFTDLDLFFTFSSFFSFSLTNVCLPCQLHIAYAVLWAANRFIGSETP